VSEAAGEPSPAIRAVGLSKTFRLPHERRTTLREYVLHPFQRTEYELQRALAGVSFEVRQGEFFGVIGSNGSGKSTLLKILARIYRPDAGSVEVNGKLTPFIELGAGFNPELSGRENVRINATLLGLSARELDDRFDAIVEFAELERFMDQKLKNYSSGMQVRLAYSIAIQVSFDILLLDEVLAVGDHNFQEKCFATFEAMRESGKTVVLVTHGLETVDRFCDRSLLLREGVVEAIGRPDEVKGIYLKQEETRAGQTGHRPGGDGSLSTAPARRAGSGAGVGATTPEEEPRLSRDGIASMPPEEIENFIQGQGRPRHHAGGALELVEQVQERERDFARVAVMMHLITRRHYEYLPVPPESLRMRAGAPTSELDYHLEGLLTAEMVRNVFGEAPAKPTLEWGCGSGWTMRWLSCYPEWRTNYHGCDPDPEAVAWLSSQSSFRVEICPHQPPLPYPAATFGGVFSFDMLTWLDPREHGQWFAELARLLEAGGLAYVATNGPFTVKDDDRARTALQAQGWAYTTEGEERTRAVVTPEYTRSALDGLFRVESYHAQMYMGKSGWTIRRLD